MAATGLELCKGHFIAKAVLPFLDLARRVRNKVTPDLGQVTGKGLFGVTLDMDGCYWFGALQAPLHCKSSALAAYALQSTVDTSSEVDSKIAAALLDAVTTAALDAALLGKADASALAALLSTVDGLPFLDLARQVRNKVTPDWGQVTGKGLFGVTLDMDGCYWIGALQGPLHCKSSSALSLALPDK